MAVVICCHENASETFGIEHKMEKTTTTTQAYITNNEAVATEDLHPVLYSYCIHHVDAYRDRIPPTPVMCAPANCADKYV